MTSPLDRISKRIGPFLGLIAIFVSGVVLCGIPFLNPYNQWNVIGRVSIAALPAVGMTFVILSGGIDLSVGSLVSLASVISAMLLMQRGWTRASAVVIPVFGLCAAFAGYQIAGRLTQRLSGFSRPAIRLLSAAGAGTSALIFTGSVRSGFSPLAVLILVPVFGWALGALSGWVISMGRIQPFVVTLGMMSSAVGLAKFIAGKGGQIHPVYYEAPLAAAGAHTASPSFEILASRIPGPVPVPVTGIFFIAATALAALILSRTRYGRYVYAIGGNEETARLSGIHVRRIKIATYALSGALAALAGVLYCASYTQGKPDAGATWELDAIAAVVIGGTSLLGGKGSVTGTMIGVLILGYLGNILNLREVPSEVQDILKGVIIVGAVMMQRRVRKRE